MTGLLGKKPAGADSPAYTGLDLQTSALGVAIPVLIGKDRLVPNLIWFGDFKATKGKVQGGKGGVVSGGKGATGIQEYSASVMLAFCEGAVGGSAGGWNSKSYTSMSALGMTLFDGSQTSPWGYLTTSHSADAFVYPGTAYAAVANLQLGNSPTIGNFSFEIQHQQAGSYGSESDKDIAEICQIVLTDARLGVNFASAGDFTDAKNYCKSLGLIGSVYVRDQAPVRDLLASLAKSANMEWLWSGGALTLVPLGDSNTSGNGYSWTAPVTPLYDLGEDDFVGRVETERSRASDAKNSVTIEWKDRANEYNVTTTTAKDEASIAQIGVRAASSMQAHHWKKPEPAMLSAQFELARYAKRNAYRGKIDARYSHLEPLDLVTHTDALAEIDHVPARIDRVTIAPDGSVAIQTKEWLSGQGNAAAYTFETSTRPGEDFNAAAPDVAAPYLFEPPPSVTDGRRELWIAVNGPGIWGGCEVYISDDDTTYRLVDTIYGGARYGALTTTLPTGASPDTTHTPRVSLSVSQGDLQSGTTADATALNTLSLIDNELIAYRDATLISANVYDLGYLVRGARGTSIASHAIGAKFVRLDENIATYEFAADRVGATVYLKFVSFNHTGGGRQALADVSAYTYTLGGTSYFDPTTLLPIGDTNRIRYSRMEAGTVGYGSAWDSGVTFVSLAAATFLGRRFIKLTATMPATAGKKMVITTPSFVVTAGERLSCQSRLQTSGPCAQTDGYINFYDSAGAQIGSPVYFDTETGVAPFYAAYMAGFVTAPTGAVTANLMLQYVSTAAGGTAELVMIEPMVTGASSAQTVHPAFSAGPNVATDTETRLAGVESSVASIATSAIRIGNGLYGSNTTLSGTSFITLNSAAVTGIPAGYVVTFDSAAIDSGAGVSHMSAAGTILGEWDIAHVPTSGGTPVSLFSGTFKATMPATGEPTDLELTGAGNPAAVALTYTGDVTFLLRMKRLSGPSSNTNLQGAFRGLATP